MSNYHALKMDNKAKMQQILEDHSESERKRVLLAIEEAIESIYEHHHFEMSCFEGNGNATPPTHHGTGSSSAAFYNWETQAELLIECLSARPSEHWVLIIDEWSDNRVENKNMVMVGDVQLNKRFVREVRKKLLPSPRRETLT